jgi:hypothetical protein
MWVDNKEKFVMRGFKINTPHPHSISRGRENNGCFSGSNNNNNNNNNNNISTSKTQYYKNSGNGLL